MSKGNSWLRRLLRWLMGPTEEESPPVPEAPKPLPPKNTDHAPQGRLYQMLGGPQETRIAGNRPKGQRTPIAIYDFCGVVFPKADIVYHYLNPDPTIRVGDPVLVPVHVHGVTKDAQGIVVSTGTYLAQCVPYPVKQSSYIIRKL